MTTLELIDTLDLAVAILATDPDPDEEIDRAIVVLDLLALAVENDLHWAELLRVAALLKRASPTPHALN